MKCLCSHIWRRGAEFRKAQKGAVAIEFVVTLPLFLAALALSFEFGRLFVAHHDTVNNVREAARYLSRSQLSATDLTTAETIVRTGVASGGTAPDWLSSATVSINPSYSTFSTSNYRVSGQVVRIQTTVDFPMTILDFAVDGDTTIPFVVIDDIRHFGA